MVSRANYFAITLIMLIVLVMFQLTGISEAVLMNTGENIHAAEAVTEELAAQERAAYDSLTAGLSEGTGDGRVGLAGSRENPALQVGENWCISQKKEYCFYGDLSEAAEDPDGAEILIADGKSLGTEDGQALLTLSGQGRNVILSGLPDTGLLEENRELRQALGIVEIEAEEIRTEGFRLFAGLMLGGEVIYEEYPQEMPYARLGNSVKVYAVARQEEAQFQGTDREDLPAVIWRYAGGEGAVYVVNGDYLTGQAGAGLLTGFAAEMEPVYVYPVVNAQVTVVENYPVLTDENTAFMEEEYGQDATAVFRDILWPSIVAVQFDTEDALTVSMAPRLDYHGSGETEEQLLEFYYEQVTKESGEIGLSGWQVSDVPLEEKLQEDMELLHSILPDYQILTFQAGGLEEEEYRGLVGKGKLLEDVNTVLTDYKEEDASGAFFSYLDGDVLQLPVYMDSRYMEDPDDFRSRCLQTAYGYYGSALDAAVVIYPEGEADRWNLISQEWAENYRPYRVPFECFDKMTASEADRRVRNYLAADWQFSVSEDQITIQADAPGGETYYVLRLHGSEVAEITGGTAEEIEEGWYLITVTEETARIRIEEQNLPGYYIQ